jgi:Flp pilus assembly pilin Flp
MTRRISRSLAQDQSGATIVEFAILAIPLLLVVLGFMELGYQSYVRAVLQGTLNDVARVATVENPRLGDTSLPLETRIENRVKGKMGRLVRTASYNFKISNYQSFGAVAQPEALVTDVNGNGRYDSGDCWEDTNPNGAFDLDGGQGGVGGADDVVVYEVTLTAPNLLPVARLVGGNGKFETKAASMTRRQPFQEQRSPEVAC